MSAELLCPMLGGKPCLGRRCAWHTEEGCAMIAVPDAIIHLEYQLRKMVK